jgi:PD-(D/E)XK nuclease superfamily
VPKGKFATLTSWSFSVYSSYIKCPYQICLEKVQRIRITEPENPAFVKGNRIHASADACIKAIGKAPKIPDELKPIKDQLVRFRKLKAKTEQEWAFDKQWNAVAWNDWDRAWLRIKTDVCADTLEPPTVDIVDWKTGKQYDDHKNQRSLYAMGGLQLVQLGALAGGSKDTMLTAQHVYVDTGLKATESYQMKQLPTLKREWLARIDFMMKDTVYAPKPSISACKYCKFSAKKGGPCKDGVL